VKGHVHDAQAVARERLGMLFAASLVLYLLSKLRPKSDSFPQLPTRTGLARRVEWPELVANTPKGTEKSPFDAHNLMTSPGFGHFPLD